MCVCVCVCVCIIVPRAHKVKNQRVIAKKTSQIMKYGQDVYIQSHEIIEIILISPS